MKLLRNFHTILRNPALAGEYVEYQMSRALHRGKAVRAFAEDGFTIGGFSGFGEFHSCLQFVNAAERRFLTEFPFVDGSIIDVGGNLGLFSLMLARRFPQRAIYAFEPNPSNFTAMRTNFARNSCPNARAYALADGAQEGQVAFQADPIDRATTHIITEGDAQDRSPVIRVPCVTLDGFTERERIGVIGLLEVDVEGYEELVLRGAERVLASEQTKTVYYEVCPALTQRAGFAPEAPSQRLLAHGYQLHFLGDSEELRAGTLSRVREVALENWVALRAE